jgi:hypothetical protein
LEEFEYVAIPYLVGFAYTGCLKIWLKTALPYEYSSSIDEIYDKIFD